MIMYSYVDNISYFLYFSIRDKARRSDVLDNELLFCCTQLIWKSFAIQTADLKINLCGNERIYKYIIKVHQKCAPLSLLI